MVDFERLVGARKENGQGMVEFALIFPIFILLVFGIIAFGHFFFVYAVSVTASREAVRYGSVSGVGTNGIVQYRDCDGIYDAANRIGAFAGITDANIVISYDTGPDSSSSYATCARGVYGPPVEPGDRIVVDVVLNYQPIVPLIEMPTLPLNTRSSRTILRSVNVGTSPPLPPPPPPTATPGGAPGDACPVAGSIAFSSRELTVLLENGDEDDNARMDSFTLDWPFDAKLKTVNLNGSAVWDSGSVGVLPPTATICSSGCALYWAAGSGAARTIGPESSSFLNLEFSKPISPGEYSISISFNNGCSLSVSGNN